MNGFAATVLRLADDAALVTLVGTVGARDVDELRAALDEAAERGAARLVVDALQAELADSAALGALYDAARAARERDGLVALVALRGGTLERVVHTAGLDVAFQLYPTRRAVLDDLGLAEPFEAAPRDDAL